MPRCSVACRGSYNSPIPVGAGLRTDPELLVGRRISYRGVFRRRCGNDLMVERSATLEIHDFQVVPPIFAKHDYFLSRLDTHLYSIVEPRGAGERTGPL